MHVISDENVLVSQWKFCAMQMLNAVSRWEERGKASSKCVSYTFFLHYTPRQAWANDDRVEKQKNQNQILKQSENTCEWLRRQLKILIIDGKTSAVVYERCEQQTMTSHARDTRSRHIHESSTTSRKSSQMMVFFGIARTWELLGDVQEKYVWTLYDVLR